MIIDIIETKAATYNAAIEALKGIARRRWHDENVATFKFETVKDNYTGELKEGYARLLVLKKPQIRWWCEDAAEGYVMMCAALPSADGGIKVARRLVSKRFPEFVCCPAYFFRLYLSELEEELQA